MEIPLLLDAARNAANIRSDRALAKSLHLSAGAVNQLRLGRMQPSEATAVKLCQLAGIDPRPVLLDLVLSKATTDDERTVWSAIRQRVVAAAIVLAIGCVASSGTSQAHPVIGCEMVYIIANRLRRWIDRVFSAFRLKSLPRRHNRGEHARAATHSERARGHLNAEGATAFLRGSGRDRAARRRGRRGRKGTIGRAVRPARRMARGSGSYPPCSQPRGHAPLQAGAR